MKKEVFALLILALLAVGCSHSNTSTEPVQPEPTAAEEQQRESTLENGASMFDEKAGNASLETDARKILITAKQFEYSPSTVEVNYGEKILLTITSLDVGHGFALPDFGINENIPPEESVTILFVADKRGEFNFFNPVYSGSGWEDMRGKLVVK